MVRIRTDLPHTSVRREHAPQWQAPLGSLPRQAPSDAAASKRSPSRRPSSFREPDPRRRGEEVFPLRTKNSQQPKTNLTGKAPYEFESVFLEERVGGGAPLVRRTGSGADLSACLRHDQDCKLRRSPLGSVGAAFKYNRRVGRTRYCRPRASATKWKETPGSPGSGKHSSSWLLKERKNRSCRNRDYSRYQNADLLILSCVLLNIFRYLDGCLRR
jgi:hypothetical protein